MERHKRGTGSKAVAYFRVSSDRQEKEGFSIPAQEKLVREFAKMHGIAIAREFVEAETAKKGGRPRFDEMVSYLASHPDCRTILAEKTDRLYRNFKDYVTLDELGVVIHFVKEGVVISKSSKSSEKFIHGIKVLIAKNYIDNLSEETRKGMQEKAEQGFYPTRAPLGYLNVEGPDRKRTIVLDPERAPIVAAMFEWYATGNYSLDAVVGKARQAGFVYHRTLKPVSRAAIHELFRNRMFTGKFFWQGKLCQGTYEPLISEELWLKVQEIMASRGKKKTRFVRHDFAFSKLISCGHCGCALVGEIKKKKYVYYHCTGYKGKCPEPFVREEVLSEKFSAVLNRLVLDDEVIGLVAVALRQSHGEQKRFRDEAVARLRAEHAKLQNRLDKIYTDKLDGVIAGDFYERKSQEWRGEQDVLQEGLARHERASRTYFEEGVQLLELAKNAAKLFKMQISKEQRRLLDFALSNCTWANGDLTVEFRQPFDLLALAADDRSAAKATKESENRPCPEKLPERDSNRRHAGYHHGT